MTRTTALFLTFSSLFVFAQKQDSVYVLNAVEISSNPSFKVGHRIERYLLNSSEVDNTNTLSELLGNESGVAFKNYGNGMLAGITNRGLSSAHTGVYWNNIPLNSTLNGQSDFSQFPTQLFSSAEFRKGGGSAILGSGSVGGAIVLNNENELCNCSEFILNTKLGSYGLQNATLRGRVNWNKLNIDFTTTLSESNNDYEVPDINGGGKLKNARFKNDNSLLNVNYEFNAGNKIKFALWNSQSKREIPGTYYAPVSKQKQNEKSNRASLQYLFQKSRWSGNLQLGYTDEDYEYYYSENSDASVSKVSNIFAIAEASLQMKKGYLLSFKLFNQNSNGKGDNFDKSKQNDFYVNSSLFKKFNQKWESSLTLQKGFSTAFNIPFTMDFGMYFQPYRQHQFYANFTTNYRTPTFNDLYWENGGNPNLKSESGWMSDLGYTFKTKNETFVFKLDGFMGRFKNWIQWLPQDSGLWQPENIKGVENYGLESELNKTWKAGNWKFELTGKYHYTVSNNRSNDKQQIYVPKNKVVFNARTSFKKLIFNYNQTWNSKRPVNAANSEYLDAFSNANISLAYSFKIKGIGLATTVTINNLYNNEYQSVQGYYMPGRNFLAAIQFNL